ncbi:PREDICTED: protein NETWORKED 4B-like [Camelina sativa]|uniref:Protein NETWORKED 4B-like n=1 Tax=Camelina sativa TaxID=90675 RepID=A0ABM0W2J4_CAMSA|nr:PREDICTED: protein NETWORKED 4B-like [Camelina sativa]
MDISFTTKETESEKKVDSSLWPHHSKSSIADILTEINQNVQSMLSLIEDDETESTEKFLCLYQSLGETYNDLNQELLNGLLKFDFNMPCSDHKNNASSLAATPLSSFKSGASLKNQLVSPTSSSEMLQSLKGNGEVEKNYSAYLLADMFCAELETAQRELEARNIDIETEKSRVNDLESKLSDSSQKIESLESELDVVKESLGVSEAEVSKLWDLLNEYKTEKANLQSGNAADLLDSLRAELRSRDIQIEQMEEYLNQVCLKDNESGTDKNVVEELRGRVEVLEKQVELQRNVIKEREEEKREAIRQLCFSLDHYMNRDI